MSAILHYQYSITHFAAKAKHFYREPAAKGRLPHRLPAANRRHRPGGQPVLRTGSAACGRRAALRAAARRAGLPPAGTLKSKTAAPKAGTAAAYFFLLPVGFLGRFLRTE